jgi:bifunctional UDP-N-acetylglucosamine pyrophosphorylase/glucosamine-1-phosphate N-acetyltransferase
VTPEDLAALTAAGVTVIDPNTTYVSPSVRIGSGTTIHPCVFLEGETIVGEGCTIHGGVRIVDSTLADCVTVLNFCVMTNATLAEGVVVGPFAHLRPGADLREGSRVGNFVELKKTVLGPGSKANHLTYLGDATVGSRVNVGAGTITCNYDGMRKHPTVIEDGAFIGSDTQLVAPVAARTWLRVRRSQRTCRQEHSASRADGRKTRKAGRSGRELGGRRLEQWMVGSGS